MTPETEIAFSRKAKHATFNDMLDVVNSIRPDMAFVVHLQPRYLGEKESIINKMNSMSESEILFPEVGRKYVLRVYE